MMIPAQAKARARERERGTFSRPDTHRRSSQLGSTAGGGRPVQSRTGVAADPVRFGSRTGSRFVYAQQGME